MMRNRGVLGSAVAITTVLALSGCTGDDEGSGAKTAGGGKQAPAISPQEYRTALEAATGPLNSALSALAEAKAYKGLTQRISTAEEAAAQASARLGVVPPPTAVADEHVKLVAALQRFNEDLRTLGSEVGDRELCTAASARGRLGRADGSAAVRDAAAALTAKGPDYRTDLDVPAAVQERTRRLPNGRFVRAGARGARGTLTIDNGGSSDSVVTLAKGKRPVYSVYVRKGKKYTVTGVRDGTYRVFFTGGSDWDAGAKSFSRDCAFERFEESLAFRTTTTATQIRWSTWRITLQPVTGGNARTSEVDPEDFPQG